MRDWPVLKQGIDYEIAADELRLQANKDLLAMHDPVQEQKLETLNLSIAQAEAELQRLIAEKLPEQQKLTDATEQRLLETQSEVEKIQARRSEAQSNLQNFLETAIKLLLILSTLKHNGTNNRQHIIGRVVEKMALLGKNSVGFQEGQAVVIGKLLPMSIITGFHGITIINKLSNSVNK